MLTYGLSIFISSQSKSLDEQQLLREKPWRVIESLAIEAERISDSGGDLKTWSLSEQANALGHVYLFDQHGVELNGQLLPQNFEHAVLRPFARNQKNTASEPALPNSITTNNRPHGLARTVFIAGRVQPLTLVFVPENLPQQWYDNIPTLPVLFMVGLILTAMGAWLYSRHLIQPIQALFLASKAVAEGDFTARPGLKMGNRNDELAALSKNFDQMSEQLGRASAFQKSLLRDVSHELRSPLARLQVAAELAMQSSAKLNPELLARVEKEIGELETLIEEILALSRLYHEPIPMRQATEDLVILTQKIVSDACFRAEIEHKSVQFDVPAEPAMCVLDERLVTRAIENIVLNAVQHTPVGTSVRVYLEIFDSQYAIHVCDQGPGVAEEDLSAIFQPFYRAQNFDRKGPPGHGIGLAIVSRIFEMHHGDVFAQNRPSGGLQVSIHLPKAPLSEVRTTQARPAEGYRS